MPHSRRRLARSVAEGAGTVLLLAVLAVFSTAVLMRCAPGFFNDERELDGRYANSIRQEIQAREAQQGNVLRTCVLLGARWMHLDLGESRTWEVPVAALIRSRLQVSFRLLAVSLPFSWVVAFAAALPFAAREAGLYDLLATALVTLTLAIPAGALATVCIVAGHGGPTFVLTTLLAGRLYRFLHPSLRQAWCATHVKAARSFGIGTPRIWGRYVLPQIRPQLIPLLGMSIMTALGALVPVEVLFDQPGIGKLAWQSSMNRDLPVLAAVTLLFSGAVALAGAIASGAGFAESA